MILLDALRTFKISKLKAPIGTPIRFNGENIGRVIRNEDDGCEIAINSNAAYSLMRRSECDLVKYNKGIEVVKCDKIWI